MDQDTIATAVAELRELADESSGCLASTKCRQVADRLERIDAERRKELADTEGALQESARDYVNDTERLQITIEELRARCERAEARIGELTYRLDYPGLRAGSTRSARTIPTTKASSISGASS